jgi:hypothetical protein
MRSDQWINTIGRGTGFHMDFGSGTWDGGPIGIPYNVVGSGVPKVPVSFYYPGESDPGPYPIPPNPLIEHGSDHHILIVDSSTCTLYELFDASYSGGTWHAGSGAIWNLNSNALRPDTWTSADAAGLPILPGLVRYDEILSGEINHAIRFTAANTNGYIWPARHLTSDDPSAPHIPPMGARFRLKASYDISGYPPAIQVILRAMKTYGIILADNGSNWYVSGAPDARWDNDMLHLLDDLTGDDFEAVDTSGLMLDYDSGATGPISTWYVRGVGRFLHGMSNDTPVPGNFNGDGRDEVATFRESNNTWYVSSLGSFAFGTAGDLPVVGDYNGDGKDDIAVFRPSLNTWYIRGIGSFAFGTAGDIPVVGDYNGDGKDDIAVFRPSNSTWYIRGIGPSVYGTVGDIPVVADYNGDGKDDIAVFRPSNSTWYVRGIGPSLYGTVGDLPVVGDYNGDGKDDIAVFRPSNSIWYIRGIGSFAFGTSGDIPVVADYNGDGKADIAVFRPE